MKTALETLFDRIEEIEFIDPAAGQFYKEVISLKEQAKAMEKEQIIQAITKTIIGSNVIYGSEYPEVIHTAEKYYNETFKAE